MNEIFDKDAFVQILTVHLNDIFRHEIEVVMHELRHGYGMLRYQLEVIFYKTDAVHFTVVIDTNAAVTGREFYLNHVVEQVVRNVGDILSKKRIKSHNIKFYNERL